MRTRRRLLGVEMLLLHHCALVGLPLLTASSSGRVMVVAGDSAVDPIPPGDATVVDSVGAGGNTGDTGAGLGWGRRRHEVWSNGQALPSGRGLDRLGPLAALPEVWSNGWGLPSDRWLDRLGPWAALSGVHGGDALGSSGAWAPRPLLFALGRLLGVGVAGPLDGGAFGAARTRGLRFCVRGLRFCVGGARGVACPVGVLGMALCCLELVSTLRFWALVLLGVAVVDLS